MAVATLEIGRHLKEDEQYLSSFGDQVVVWMVAGIGIAAEVVLVIFFVALFRGRRDKQVKFYTSRRVAPGEELVFDYGEQYWTDRKLTPLP